MAILKQLRTMKILFFLAITVAGTFAAPSLRIAGGRNAERNEFPYQVSIQSCLVGTCQHVCGATIISPSWVVTAAHCITSIPIMTQRAVVGVLQLRETNDERQVIQVSQSIIHPQYDPDALVSPHDIALMKLEHSFQYSEAVQPVKLPASGAEPSGEVMLSGWGAMASGTPFFPPVMPISLQAANITIIGYQECYNAIRSLTDANFTLDKDSNVCTGPISSGISICGGDSGGPLTQNGVLIGIVSWGLEPCGTIGAPSVYIKISNVTSWIKENVHDLN